MVPNIDSWEIEYDVNTKSLAHRCITVDENKLIIISDSKAN
jgi:hypothetical protein